MKMTTKDIGVIFNTLSDKIPQDIRLRYDGVSIHAKKGALSWSMKAELFFWDGKIVPERIQDFVEITERVFRDGDCEGECQL